MLREVQPHHFVLPREAKPHELVQNLQQRNPRAAAQALARIADGEALVATVFDLASLTKVIAAATVAMHLVERGRLRLDAAVHDWIAEWHGEDRRMREYFGMDRTGWATPFLLVPEVTLGQTR